LDISIEDASISSKEDRLKYYGQEDHVRLYGNDFKDRLQNCYFDVRTVSHMDFSEKLVNELVLFPPVLSENPLATNYRKVYFARKR